MKQTAPKNVEDSFGVAPMKFFDNATKREMAAAVILAHHPSGMNFVGDKAMNTYQVLLVALMAGSLGIAIFAAIYGYKQVRKKGKNILGSSDGSCENGGEEGADDEGGSGLLLSLRELSPLCFIPEDWWLVVLKSYFDGGNTASNDRVTLACVCGTCEEWIPVESAWKQVIADHKAPPLHTTDANALQKEFSTQKGWGNDRVNTYISACVNVLDSALARPGKILVPTPSGYQPNITKAGLNGITMTIPLDDFRRAREVVPNFPNSISELCASEILGFVFRYGKRLGVEGYELYFDRNEPFCGHVRDRWNSPKSRRQIPELKKVKSVGESDTSTSPALQIADLFAWCINHQGDVRRDWHRRVGYLPWDSYILTYEYLINPTPGALKRTAAWGFPKRRKIKL